MSKINVAIVDDNERMVNLLEDILKEDSDIEVVGKSENGLDAIDMIKETKPDVVLLDLIMPKLDGLGVMEKIKRDSEFKKNPSFIVITAIGQEGVTESAFELGANYYIMKPFDSNVVLSRIKQLKGDYHNRLTTNHRVSAYENKSTYMERNLETDVTVLYMRSEFLHILKDIST